MAGKFKIVVSDLHLGAGFLDEGNALEDFWCDDEFAALLDQVAAESASRVADVELVINGDAFEMLQVPHLDRFDPRAYYVPEQYRSSTENDSARKMALIVAGHPVFFGAILRFLAAGPPCRRVTFVKGNHDVDLHWPAVQDCIRNAVDAAGARAHLLAFEERCVCREGLYAEHGNQYAEAASRVADMEEPHDPGRPGQLALPVGSHLVIDLFNEVERLRYWVDGVKPIHALIAYALAYDFSLAARAITTLLRSLPAATADDGLLARTPGSDLARQLDDPARLDEIGTRLAGDVQFRSWFHAEVAQVLGVLPGAEHARLPESIDWADAVALGDGVRRTIHLALHDAADRLATQNQAQVVVFGHTHEAGIEALADGAVYANSGTWTWHADLTGVGKETWRDLFEHPERFTRDRNLSYVRIEYDSDGRPTAQLVVSTPAVPVAPRVEPWWQRIWNGLKRLWRRIRRSRSISEQPAA